MFTVLMTTSHCRPGVGECAHVLRDFGSFPNKAFSKTFVVFLKCHVCYNCLQAEGIHFLIEWKKTNKYIQFFKTSFQNLQKICLKKKNKTIKHLIYSKSGPLCERQCELLKLLVGSSPVNVMLREPSLPSLSIRRDTQGRQLHFLSIIILVVLNNP